MKRIILSSLLVIGLNYAASAQIADSTQRRVPMQGAANFRDLGGYQTTDGHTVKWGKVYRSADISKLTDGDLALMKQRNITHDVDLRGRQEAAQAPDRMNPGTDYILCPAGSDSLNNSMRTAMQHQTNGDSLMTAYYSNTQYLTGRYKPMFEKLLTLPSDESLVFHCTAGKDRTGIGAALFLYSLGVPYKTIEKDYTATNYYRKAANANSPQITAMMQQMHMSRSMANSMMLAKKEYLDATFEAICKQYGSVENYLQTQIGLTPEQIVLLKSKYLQ